MSSLQRAVEREFRNFHTFAVYYVTTEAQFEHGVEVATDAILAAVRDALLSDEAMNAAIGEMSASDQDLLAEWTSDAGLSTVRDVLSAAIDAVMDDGSPSNG